MASVCLLLITSLFLQDVPLSSAGAVFLPHIQASSILRRHRRFNTGGLEEVRKGNLERECVEERCNLEEAREVFEDDEKTMEFWALYEDGDQCMSSPCQNAGQCKDGVSSYTCTCQPGFTGIHCELGLVKKCEVNNGDCMHFCVDIAGNASCACAIGYQLARDGTTCVPTGDVPCGTLGKTVITLLNQRSAQAKDNSSPLLNTTRQSTANTHNTGNIIVVGASKPIPVGNVPSPGNNKPSPVGNAPSPGNNKPSPVGNAPSPVGSKPISVGNVPSPVGSKPISVGNVPSPVGSKPISVGNVPSPVGSKPISVGNVSSPVGSKPISVGNASLTSNNKLIAVDFLPSSGDNKPITMVNKATGPVSKPLSVSSRSLEVDEKLNNLPATASQEGPGRARIVGGYEVTPGEIPWQVALVDRNTQLVFCGGSILSEWWVVTAAHCLPGGKDNSFFIRAGEHNVKKREGAEQDVEITEQHTHPQYNTRVSRYNHDVALLRTRTPIRMNEVVRPLCLGPPTFTEWLLQDAPTGRVSGWGRLRYSGAMSPVLRRVDLPFVERAQCMASSSEHVTRHMFCAGYADQSRDACQGDSGGPHASRHGNTWFLTGIISWGEECAAEGKYGIYTRITHYYPWITQVTGLKKNSAINKAPKLLPSPLL